MLDFDISALVYFYMFFGVLIGAGSMAFIWFIAHFF